jgi:formylglycine-generating enzyme required for sulfatase activity
MATLHASWGQLPEDRADLLEETVKLLLGRWQRAREVKGEDGVPVVEPGIAQCLNVGEERIRAALEHIALQVHRRQREGGGEDGAPADVPEGDVLLAFKPLLGSVHPDMLTGYLRDRAGLLVARREGMFAFPHRSFQEYLAACRLSKQPDFCAVVRSDPKWWREVWLLGTAKVMRGTPLAVVGLMNELLPAGPSEIAEKSARDWQAASLVGQAIVETRLGKDVGGQPSYEALLRRCRDWLVQLVEGGELAARERAEAGDVLGQLGDPRFDPAMCNLPRLYRGEPEPLLGFVEVPAGPFVMGSRKGEKDAYAYAWELGNPPMLEMPYRYWIGRYPVTVGQFKEFVEGGGYEEERLWMPLGWRWRRGECDSQLKDTEVRQWLATRPAPLRGQPMWWEEQRRFGSRPVVGVSWFEAMAYAAWLDRRLRDRGRVPDGYAVRLATEAEWEKSARGETGRRYPWGGEDWSEERANIEASGIGGPSAVGMYPARATPEGIHDLGRTVWEWTLSRYRAYPYRPDDGRNDPEGEGDPVLRGGSWLDGRRGARCAVRHWLVPGDFGFIGFRVVVSLANSGF